MEATRKKLAHVACVPLVALSLAASHAVAQSSQQGSNQAGSAQDQSTLSRQEVRNYEGARATQLIGTRVVDKQGKRLGKIDDLVVHMSTGDVRYAILAQRVANDDERLYAVPLDRFSSTSSGQLQLDVRGNELGNQRWWRKEKWPGLQDSAFWGEIDRLSGLPAVQPSQQYYAHRVSDLIGKDVTTPAGTDLGTVRDLVIDVGHEKVHYAILDFQGAGAQAEARYAVPITAFMFPQTGGNRGWQTDRLVLNIDVDKIGQMHSFSDDRWPDFGDPSRVAQIDRYLVLFFPENQAAGTGGTGAGARSAATGGGSERMDTLFQFADRDSNGSIDRDEFARYEQSVHSERKSMPSSGATSGAAAAGRSGSTSDAFDAMDRNGNGEIDRSEYERALGTGMVR